MRLAVTPRWNVVGVLGLLAASLGAGVGSWWLGRPARHLAEARRLIDAGEPADALIWLRLPEANPSTRDRAPCSGPGRPWSGRGRRRRSPR